MEQINISINNRLAKQKDFQTLVLKMLIVRKLLVEDNDISQKYITCYSSPKPEDVSNDKYITSIEKCIAQHKKQFNITHEHVASTFSNIKKAEESFTTRKVNCFNLVGESELENCQEVERRTYLLRLKAIYESLPRQS